MTRDDDEFEGIDINAPWGGIRIGSGRYARRWGDDDDEIRRIRRRVRRRLDFYRHAVIFVMVMGALAAINAGAGGQWRWYIIVTAIWGAFLALQFITTFMSPLLWDSDVEERMVRREVERRRGRVRVMPEDDEGPSP